MQHWFWHYCGLLGSIPMGDSLELEIVPKKCDCRGWKARELMYYPWFASLARSLVKSLQSCPTLCDPIDGSPPGSPVPGILQTRTLEWVVISFSNAWKWKVKVKSLSRVQLLANPWTAAYQPPPSMGFSRQEYWSGVPMVCISLPKFSGCLYLC